MKVARPKYPNLAKALALALQQGANEDNIPPEELFPIFNHVLSCQPYTVVGTLHPHQHNCRGLIIDDDGKKVGEVQIGDPFIE